MTGKELLAVIGAILAIVLMIFNYIKRRNSEKRKQAEQARKDLDEANQNNDAGKFLDAFGRM